MTHAMRDGLPDDLAEVEVMILEVVHRVESNQVLRANLDKLQVRKVAVDDQADGLCSKVERSVRLTRVNSYLRQQADFEV